MQKNIYHLNPGLNPKQTEIWKLYHEGGIDRTKIIVTTPRIADVPKFLQSFGLNGDFQPIFDNDGEVPITILYFQELTERAFKALIEKLTENGSIDRGAWQAG